MSSTRFTRKAALSERFGRRELIEFLVVALLEVDDVSLARTGDLNHRKAIRRGVGERDDSVEEAGRGDGQADARPLGEEPGRRCRVPRVAFVPETDVADARGLRDARHICDRDADDAVDGADVVELERVDDQVISVGELGCGVVDRCCAPFWRAFGTDVVDMGRVWVIVLPRRGGLSSSKAQGSGPSWRFEAIAVVTANAHRALPASNTRRIPPSSKCAAYPVPASVIRGRKRLWRLTVNAAGRYARSTAGGGRYGWKR